MPKRKSIKKTKDTKPDENNIIDQTENLEKRDDVTSPEDRTPLIEESGIPGPEDDVSKLKKSIASQKKATESTPQAKAIESVDGPEKVVSDDTPTTNNKHTQDIHSKTPKSDNDIQAQQDEDKSALSVSEPENRGLERRRSSAVPTQVNNTNKMFMFDMRVNLFSIFYNVSICCIISKTNASIHNKTTTHILHIFYIFEVNYFHP